MKGLREMLYTDAKADTCDIQFTCRLVRALVKRSDGVVMSSDEEPEAFSFVHVVEKNDEVVSEKEIKLGDELAIGGYIHVTIKHPKVPLDCSLPGPVLEVESLY